MSHQSCLHLLERSCLSENRVYVVVHAVTHLVKAVLDCYAVTCSCFFLEFEPPELCASLPK